MTDETGFLRNPLAHWRNDDLMLTEAMREEVKADRPRAFPVLDWPELRALFEEIDERAKAAKRKVRSRGAQAVLVAAAGLVIAALASWLAVPGETLARMLGIVAALMLVGGVLWGAWPRLRGHARSDWLIARLQCERLRQLHFQLLLGRIELAVRAMDDAKALATLETERQRALVRFRDRYMAMPSPTLHEVLGDIAADRAWMDETWGGGPPSGKELPSSDAVELLDAFHRLRFGVQRHYASLTVQEHVSAPGVRSGWLRKGADVLTAGMLLSSLVLAFALILEWTDLERACVALTAAFAAGVAALRTLEGGLRYGTDAHRMGWYLAALDALEAGYDRQQVPGRIRLHKQFEMISYREMQEFLMSHHQARFVLQ